MNPDPSPTQCPLCYSDRFIPLQHQNKKTYFNCDDCGLIFLNPSERLPLKDDRARYLKHNNSPTDPEYRNFLKRLTSSIIPKLKSNAHGLDYGAGYAPTLSLIMEEEGYTMDNFDLHFFPNKSLLQKQYDFITCCETIEHFRSPLKEFEQFNRLLKKVSWLGIMTEILESETDFQNWWYPHDVTHVVFYQRNTFDWISKRYRWGLERPRKNVVLFQKS